MKPILVVDDNPLDIEAAIALLQHNRILNPIITFDNGAELISYLAGNGRYADRTVYPYPVLLLLDFKMAGVSGPEVLRWLKQTEQPVKVVMMTGLDLRHVKESYALGAQSYLSKPLIPAEFSNLLKRLPGLYLRMQGQGMYFEAFDQDRPS